MKNEAVTNEPASISNFKKKGNFKYRALRYLGFTTRPELTKTELKILRARAKKLKKASRANERSISQRLLKQFNF
jgi:hypothetical protein|tara:strand:- start:255 stop:479 length:225 start_codon:yes stop_codon:yes gene_type:complete